MKKFAIMFLCLSALAISALCPGIYAQGSNDSLESKVEKMEKMLNELKGQLREQTKATNELKAMKAEISKISAPTAPADDFYWAKKAQELENKGLAPAFGKQYGKPFLRRFGRNTYIGGYIDHELEMDAGSQTNKTFDQHRLIPFIYSDVSDRVKFATEIEIEHGGTNTQGGVQNSTGSLKVEFATVDFLMADWLNYRGGLILAPLGKFNLIHDSPLQDLTDRPMVSTHILPTTLVEAGMGFFGTFYPSELSKLDYEIYLVNGFQSVRGSTSVLTAADAASASEIQDFIKDSRGSKQSDNNTNFAVLGRVGYSPFLGLEIGASVHSGYIDDSDSNRMTIKAIDWTYQRGAFELVGEYGHASIEREGFMDDGTQKSDRMAGDMWGVYAEPRYHFMPQILKDAAPTFFTDNSTFTAVLRLGYMDINQPTNVANEGDILRSRITPGINFRYTEDTVFKLEYQFNDEHGRRINAGDPRGTSQSNDSLVFSVATYF
ncbi:MAG: hypothetical protein R2568_09140 [Candidatus Scalindua sp.]|jgi:hypothetical protein|nr:hypothetical protein [Candidatus Scalindua sp.]MDV5166899.1 hypothetical protein [Candidatus Scalindua sp.]